MLTVQENYSPTIQNKGTSEMSYPSLRNNQDQVAMWFHYLCKASKCHLSFNKRWQVLHVQVFYKRSVLILIHSIHTLLIPDKRFITQILQLIVCSSPFFSCYCVDLFGISLYMCQFSKLMCLDHKLPLGKILFSLSIPQYLTLCVPDAYLRLPRVPACSHKQNKTAFDIESVVLFKHQ